MKTLFFLALVQLHVLIPCPKGSSNDLYKAEWLLGTWENKLRSGVIIYETWVRKSENEFTAKSYVLREGDTLLFESIQLIAEGEGLFYIPTVVNQNDGLPVRFAATLVSETQLTFKNTEHDFPQVISYFRLGSDSLLAEISGIQNKQERKTYFPMRRLN